MGRIGALLKNRLFIAFVGVVFLSLVIWFAGPFLGIKGQVPLETSTNRLIAITGMFVSWLLSVAFRFIRSRQHNAMVLDSLVDDAISPEDAASAEELEILQNKMQEAVSTLKQKNFSKKGGSRFIYELPWYTIIGPPGSGKTTLLSNSGLDFPLENTQGNYVVKGVGGTRNCDWWFTDQAVLLDTAGRYTTQDSEAEVDKSAWNNFLSLLKQKRGRRPINGVLVALSIEDIIQSDDETLTQSARTIRTRIEELYSKLGVSPPVYLMFTKCDLLAGFAEYFGELDRDGRAQVWGVTLPLDDETDHSVLISNELDALVDTINRQSIDKLHHELSQRNREMIYSFPKQFANIQPRIREFVSQLTVRSRLLEDVFFRGVYFTSATQSGSVFDQVIEKVSRSFGIDESLRSVQADSGKSYFINRLLTDVVFNESGLAGTNLKTERRLTLLQLGAGAMVTLLLLGVSSLWIASYLKNRDAINRIESAGAELQQSLSALPGNNLDPLATNQVLSHARRLRFGADGTRDQETGLTIKLAGLYQGNKVDELAERKYEDLLIDALLPRLMVRLENQMHAENNNSEFLFEALKTYQMIEDREHFDSDAVIGWFNFDFDTNLPGDTPNKLRSSLKQHVAHLFRERPYRLPRDLDKGLIEQYQKIAANLTAGQRAYNRIRNTTRGQLDPYFRLSANAGPEVVAVFSRADSVSLDQSVPAFFTLDGYQRVFLPASADISQTLAADNWVLGEAAIAPGALTPVQLQQSVKQIYFREYIDTWESLIRDLQIKPLESLQKTSEFIAMITDVDSPLKKLLVLIAEQTTLVQPPETADDIGTKDSASDRESQLSRLLNPDAGVLTGVAVESIDPVTEHFTRLHKLVANWESNTSQLDQLIIQIAEINIQLLPMAQSPSGNIDTQLNKDLAISMQKLTSKAGRLPEPLSSLMQDLTNEVSDVVGGGFCQQLDAAWKTDVYAYYKRAISNRYPVNRNGTADIALSDFGTFFGQGGIVDTFVSAYLSSLVQKTPGRWTWVGTGAAVCLSDNTLKQLAFAEDIKNTFFTQFAQSPSFRFDVVPEGLRMSPDIDQLYLDIGSERMQYFHGPITGATSFSWPGNNTQVSLRVEPVIPGTSANISLSGPWAVLRLFEQGAREAARGSLIVNYSFSGRPVTLTLATSSFNPLNSVALRNFRAPENL